MVQFLEVRQIFQWGYNFDQMMNTLIETKLKHLSNQKQVTSEELLEILKDCFIHVERLILGKQDLETALNLISPYDFLLK